MEQDELYQSIVAQLKITMPYNKKKILLKKIEVTFSPLDCMCGLSTYKTLCHVEIVSSGKSNYRKLQVLLKLNVMPIFCNQLK